MPIKIPDNLPASKILKEENIFVMNETRATTQKIRPLKLLILNIMPTKIITETQLLRLLSNSPLQIEVDWIHMASHESKNVSKEHLLSFYKTFDDIKENRYDGLIITGAPVEKLKFEEVDYVQPEPSASASASAATSSSAAPTTSNSSVPTTSNPGTASPAKSSPEVSGDDYDYGDEDAETMIID